MTRRAPRLRNIGNCWAEVVPRELSAGAFGLDETFLNPDSSGLPLCQCRKRPCGPALCLCPIFNEYLFLRFTELLDARHFPWRVL